MEIVDVFVTARQRNPRQLKKRIREADFRIMPEQDAVVLIGKLLLYEREIDPTVFEFPTDNRYTARIMRLADKGSKRLYRALINWFYVGTGHAGHLYTLYLYNLGFGKITKIFDLLLKSEPVPPPYLYRMLPNILRFYFTDEQIAPLLANTNDLQLWAPALNELFREVAPVQHWLENKDRPLHYYGGQTNTILGVYDEFFGVDTGAQLLNRHADVYYDLGGGYNTPEIDRLTGLRFTSLDLLAPNSHTENLMLVRKVPRGELLVSGQERQDYLDRLGQTPHMRFDVFEDDFPAEHQSYVIVSTGFLTSTVRANSLGNGGLGFYRTSLAGIEKIMRLVQMGKDVDLFTVSRPTVRLYAYKTILLSFRNGRLVNMVTTPDRANRYSNERKADLLRLIRPETSPFRGHEERTDDRWVIRIKNAADVTPPQSQGE